MLIPAIANKPSSAGPSFSPADRIVSPCLMSKPTGLKIQLTYFKQTEFLVYSKSILVG